MPEKSATFPQAMLSTLFCLCCLALAIAEDGVKQPEQKQDAEVKTKKTVSLVIDFSDGVQIRFPAIPWKQECTALDALTFAAEHPHGVTFQSRGTGATALLYRIDDVENQGGRGLNWIFKVNGKLGNCSFAITPLEPGDRVLWKFDEYR